MSGHLQKENKSVNMRDFEVRTSLILHAVHGITSLQILRGTFFACQENRVHFLKNISRGTCRTLNTSTADDFFFNIAELVVYHALNT